MIRGFEVDCDKIQVNAPPYFSAVLYLEPLMTEVTRFLGTEHTCKRISLLTEVSLVY